MAQSAISWSDIKHWQETTALSTSYPCRRSHEYINPIHLFCLKQMVWIEQTFVLFCPRSKTVRCSETLWWKRSVWGQTVSHYYYVGSRNGRNAQVIDFYETLKIKMLLFQSARPTTDITHFLFIIWDFLINSFCSLCYPLNFYDLLDKNFSHKLWISVLSSD